MNRPLKIGIVGAGVFGAYHALKCIAHKRAELVGLYDHTEKRCKKIAAGHDVKPYNDYEAMLAEVEAIIIASPAQSHGVMAIKALEAGKHCLIEKPIATRLEEAHHIVSLAKEKNLIVQIGHQERFVMQAIGIDKISESPEHISAFRMGQYSVRGTDVSVTLDLMTHDLDLVMMLVGEPPIKISSAPIPIRSKMADASLAQISFPSGCTARLHASRVEEDFRRTMDVVYPNGTVSIDFNSKTLSHNTPFDLNEDFGKEPSAKDSLGAATNAFVEAVLNGTDIPITAQDGYKALEMALIIDRGILWERDA